jgi:hypothetical protein
LRDSFFINGNTDPGEAGRPRKKKQLLLKLAGL